MCTVTFLAGDDAGDALYRLVTNRDEQRTRPPALPPQQVTCGRHQAIMPIDPVANGSWVGVNDAGLTVTLLNVYPPEPPGRQGRARRRSSRGNIVRELLACATESDALERVQQLDARRYPPFHVLMVGRDRLTGLRWDGREAELQDSALQDAPRLYASSGLGDDKVIAPRRKLFAETVLAAAPAQRVSSQSDFHRHQWEGHPELSVCMARSDARTVSVTTVEVGERQARLHYHGAPPDEAADAVTLSLSVVWPGAGSGAR